MSTNYMSLRGLLEASRRSIEVLRMQVKALERERDSLQVKLINQAITADELRAAEETIKQAIIIPKMLRQCDDYRQHSRKHKRR